ncbi:MAG: helix-turn-helix domain-containing protein [Terriglobia bacterium]|jgi:excisionase family DNA binding protein
MSKRLHSIAETAEYLGVSKDTIRRLINRKVLLAVRISRRVLVPLSEIERACQQGVGRGK